MKAEIEIDGIPEGWEPVGIKPATFDDFVLAMGQHGPCVQRVQDAVFYHQMMLIARPSPGYRVEMDAPSEEYIAVKDYEQAVTIPVIFYAHNSREEAQIRRIVKDLPSKLLSEGEHA